MIPIGELDAGRLKGTLQSVHRRLLRISAVLDARDSIGGDAGLFSEFPHTPPDGSASHAKLNCLHKSIVQIEVDMVAILSQRMCTVYQCGKTQNLRISAGILR
jgi:hypothetical protein